jgi:hypothetical protein
MSVTSEADYSRSLEVLLRHGFVVQQCVSTEKFRCPSPVGPVQQFEQDEAEDDGYGMRRVASERSLRRRSVTWDLSIYDRIPSLPFRNNNKNNVAKPSSQNCDSPSPPRCTDPSSSDEILPRRRSSVKTVAVDLPETTREYDPSAKKSGVTTSTSIPQDVEQGNRRKFKAIHTKQTKPVPSPTLTSTTEMLKQEVLPKKRDDTEQPYSGYRDDYYLGDVIRSTSHMLIECTPNRATQDVGMLKTHDFVWIKRSNGLYTYAILANRSSSPSPSCASTNGSTTTADSDDKEYMYFVLNDCGATKMVYKNNWSKCIRFVNGTN